MRIWRVSLHRDLSGVGGLYVHGRWHTRGHLVTYAAEHPATAQLEWLVHLDVQRPEDAPATIPFSEIEIPDDVGTMEITLQDLRSDWRSNLEATQTIGDRWLDETQAAILFVPSAITPERNILLNPGHRDASRIRVVRTFDYVSVTKR